MSLEYDLEYNIHFIFGYIISIRSFYTKGR